jgi:hypothetical protein
VYDARRRHQDRKQEQIMDFGLGILTFGTIGFMVAFGYLSARATEKRRKEGHPKSTLAADAPNTREALERA